MKICIYGAGAIGGWVGGLLARAGADVTLIARGAHLAAMRENGLKVVSEAESFTTRPACTDDPAEAGPQDVVIVTLKAPSVPAQVPRMAPLLGPDTAVVTAANGVPWWYFHGLEGPWADRRLESVDPGNLQWDGIGPSRAIGAVLWLAHELRSLLLEVPLSRNIRQDFRQWQNDRLMAHYQPLRPWCELILGDQSPLAISGEWRGISMLFPMEVLFERYVEVLLRRQLLAGSKLRAQLSGQDLCLHQERGMFRLKPDLLLDLAGQNWVLDTKWKLLDAGCFLLCCYFFNVAKCSFFTMFVSDASRQKLNKFICS